MEVPNEHRPNEGKLEAARRKGQGEVGQVDRQRLDGNRRKARSACWENSGALWNCSRRSRASGDGLRNNSRKDLDQLQSYRQHPRSYRGLLTPGRRVAGGGVADQLAPRATNANDLWCNA